MLVTFLIILFCVFLSSYLLLEAVVIEKHDITKIAILNSLQQEKSFYNQWLKKLRNNSLFSQLYSYLNSLIFRSGLKKILPWMTSSILATLLVLVFLIVSLIFKDLGFTVAITYGFIGVFSIICLLVLMSLINKNKIKKSYLTFLNVYTNFYGVEPNEINALLKTADYVEEPINYVIQKWATKYKMSNISFDECMDGILLELGGDREFRKFIGFTKQNAKYGGDYLAALKKMIVQGERTAEKLSVKTSSAIVGTVIILLMVLIDIFMLFNQMKEPEILQFLQTGKGQFNIIGNALAIIFALYMIININKD